MGDFVFELQLLDEQVFTDACCTPRTALASEDGSEELRPTESHPLCALPALNHDLLRTPPVGATEIRYFLNFVVRWDTLDYPHAITSSSLFPVAALLQGSADHQHAPTL